MMERLEESCEKVKVWANAPDGAPHDALADFDCHLGNI